jgi:dipeptidase E
MRGLTPVELDMQRSEAACPAGTAPRLILYSDQFHADSQQLDAYIFELTGTRQPRLGYIPANADPARRYYQEQAHYYRRYGLALEPYFELDLRYRPELLPELLSAEAIHLTGGNTFYFLKWLKSRGVLESLRQYSASGGVLIGVSAGAILMTPDVEPGQLCGDRLVSDLPDWQGLGLVDFHFLPHLERFPDPEGLLREYSARKDCTVYGCPDGTGLVVCGSAVIPVGKVVCFRRGEQLALV